MFLTKRLQQLWKQRGKSPRKSGFPFRGSSFRVKKEEQKNCFNYSVVLGSLTEERFCEMCRKENLVKTPLRSKTLFLPLSNWSFFTLICLS